MGRKVKALTKTLEGTQVWAAPLDHNKQSRDLVLAVLAVHLVVIALVASIFLGPTPVSSGLVFFFQLRFTNFI
jgi:hypothetical protein